MPSSPAPSPPSSRPSARALLRSPEVVAAQGRQICHNSRVVHSTIYNSPKSAQILVGLTTCSYSLGKSRFTIRLSRLIRIRNSKKRIHNPPHTIRGFEPESMLIIMFCGLMDREKGKNGLRVIYTQRSAVRLCKT